MKDGFLFIFFNFYEFFIFVSIFSCAIIFMVKFPKYFRRLEEESQIEKEERKGRLYTKLKEKKQMEAEALVKNENSDE